MSENDNSTKELYEYTGGAITFYVSEDLWKKLHEEAKTTDGRTVEEWLEWHLENWFDEE